MTAKNILLILHLLLLTNIFGQEQIESQHRIKKSQFPAEALQTLKENSSNLKRLRFYQEIDTSQKVYTAMFKKSRLFYELDFDKNGEFINAAFSIKQVDIPEDNFKHISDYLMQHFSKFKIRKMLQVYPKNSDDSVAKIIKNTFQNLMVPNMNYKLFVRGKINKKQENYIALFDSKGNLLQLKNALPANYDRVLY